MTKNHPPRWRRHPEFKTYEISSAGLVRNATTKKPYSRYEDRNGRAIQPVYNGERRTTKTVASLVFEAFHPNVLDRNPREEWIVHLDGDATNDSLDNLQLVDSLVWGMYRRSLKSNDWTFVEFCEDADVVRLLSMCERF